MSFSSKPILFVLVRIRRQPAAAVSVSDSFNSCIQRIEQNKQQCLFHFPVLEKRPYFAYSLTQSRFAFYFGTTPFIANLLSGGILDQTEARRAEKNVFETAPSYLRVWTLSPPHPRRPPLHLKVWTATAPHSFIGFLSKKDTLFTR